MKIFYQNDLFRVTEFGIEHTRAAIDYMISAEELLKLRGFVDGRFYDWPLHMASKSWVDLQAFEEAFRVAHVMHAGRYQGAVDLEKLDASFVEARRLAAVFWN